MRKMEKKLKTILIVGAGIYQKPLIEYAALVCRVVCAAPKIPDDCRTFISKSLLCDVTDKEGILAFAKEEKIDGVTTDQTDIAVRTVAYVAEKMGLPGIGYKTACLFTDKNLMRNKLESLGIKVLPYSLVHSQKEAQSFFKENGGRAIILKPVDSQGSRGVFVCRTQEDVAVNFVLSQKYSRDSSVLAEVFASGKEFVMEAICLGYRYKPLILGDSRYFKIENMFAPYERTFPACIDKKLEKRILDLNKKIIKGFGLKQGICHSEYIMEGDDIYLIETAARGGGCFISSDLIHLGTGLNTEEFLINVALGMQKHIPQINHETKACGYMALLIPEGKIIRVDGIEKVTQLPYVHRNLLDQIKIGKETVLNLDKTSRYVITVEAENISQLKERMDYIKTIIDIKIQSEDGIKSCLFGTENVTNPNVGGVQ